MKKILVMLLTTMLLLLSVGCENVEYKTESSQPESSVDIFESLESKLPDFVPTVSEDDSSTEGEESDSTSNSYIGAYTIVTDDAKAFYQDESTPGTISSAIEERNSFLRQKYGVDVDVKQATTKEIMNGLRQAEKSGI
ncbi:MAG: hypothetical protein IJB49_09480, partial [Clostridia bacterium]|nr:hypothetical protein [Clostridia bacterium]